MNFQLNVFYLGIDKYQSSIALQFRPVALNAQGHMTTAQAN